jgi:Zn ribbon nucleic-acid-binding protein
MKSLIRRRREAGAVCANCHSPDYTMSPPYYEGGKPNFTCNQCGKQWQYGYDGGIFKELEKDNKS